MPNKPDIFLKKGIFIDDYSKKGVALIGTNHRFDIMSIRYLSLRKRISSLAKSANYSMVEGIEHRSESSDPTQRLVIDNCRGEIIYSEEDISYKDLLASYAVPEGLYGVWIYWAVFNNFIDRKISTDEFNNTFYKTLFGLSQQPVTGFDLEKTARQGYMTIEKFPYDQIMPAANSFLEFFRDVRDYEIFGPKFDELSGREGNKVVALGLEHIFPLIERLKGKYMPRPLNWDEFVLSIDDKSRAVLKAASI